MSAVGEAMLSDEEIQDLLGNFRQFKQRASDVNNDCKDINTKQSILGLALEAVNRRCQTHGETENNFQIIADLWNAYCGGDYKFSAIDVSVMMILMKIARVKSGGSLDNFVDIAGYAACGGELYGKEAK